MEKNCSQQHNKERMYGGNATKGKRNLSNFTPDQKAHNTPKITQLNHQTHPQLKQPIKAEKLNITYVKTFKRKMKTGKSNKP
jgi:hypothetical protein